MWGTALEVLLIVVAFASVVFSLVRDRSEDDAPVVLGESRKRLERDRRTEE